MTTDTQIAEVQSQQNVQAYITSEDYSPDDVSYMPGTYDWTFEEGPFFEDVAIEVTEKAFQDAWIRLKPLLDKFSIHYIGVGISMYGMLNYPPILHYGNNVGESGRTTASFLMQPILLKELLTAHFEENYTIKPLVLQQFDMALIHSMDYSSGNYLQLPGASITPLTHFVSFLNGIRQVGMKRLGIFLQQSDHTNGISGTETGASDILDVMVERLASGNDLLEETKLFIDKISPIIYKIAPLLMLHAIHISGKLKGDIGISQLAVKAMNSPDMKTSHEERLQLIGYMLEMNNEDFLLAIGRSDSIDQNIYPGGIINKVYKILYADHQKNAKAYAAVITADAEKKVESLTKSFHERNEGLPEEQVLPQEYLNRELKSIPHDESGLLELAEKLYVG